jgi:hypothetical protein
MSENNIPSEYKPISMWGYFGYEILFSLPIVGFICLIIMSFVPSNKNLKNFARSYFCLFILFMILALIITAFAALGGGLAYVSEVM